MKLNFIALLVIVRLGSIETFWLTDICSQNYFDQIKFANKSELRRRVNSTTVQIWALRLIQNQFGFQSEFSAQTYQCKK